MFKICLLLVISLGWIWSVYQSTLGMIGKETENTFINNTYEWLFFNMLALVCFGLFVLLATTLRNRLAVVIGGVVCVVTLTLQILSPIGISADYYRYIWQGRLSNTGQNNYKLIPWDAGVENANKELFEHISSRDAKSVYPPLAEQYFRLPAAIFDADILQNTSFQTRLSVSRLPNLVLFVLCAFLLYKMTRFKLVGFAWLALPFLQLELVNSAHVDVLSVALVLGALLALRSKHISAHVLTGALIAAAGMVKLTPLILIIPSVCYLLIHFSIKRALAAVIGFTAVLAMGLQAYSNDGFALTKRTIFWLSGGEFSTGNPLYEIANRVSSDYGPGLVKTFTIILLVAVITRLIRKVVRRHFTFNEMLKYSLLLLLIPFIASPIVFPWYWATSLALMLILLTSNHQNLKLSHVLILVLSIALLLTQYVDQAIMIPLATRRLFLIATSFVFYALILLILTKLFSRRTVRLRHE